jgi:hypothetical protein
MKPQTRSAITIILAGIWVNASEFFRNQVVLSKYWVDHYQSLGLTFPSEPQNGVLWIVWGFLYAVAIYIVSRRFTLVQTTLITWMMGFVLMWLVTWNLSVLPAAILVYAVPLSLLEAFVGSYLCKKLSPSH